MFCGPECRDEARKTYHKYECGITDVIHKAQIGGWALAFRAITTQPYEFYDENRKRFAKRNELLGSKNHDNQVQFHRPFPFQYSFRIFNSFRFTSQRAFGASTI